MFISQTVGIVLFMFMEEYIGKRKMYLSGIALITFRSLTMSLSQSLTTALAGKAFMGFGTFLFMRFNIATISDITEPRLSEKFISTLQGFYSLGGLIGPFADAAIKHRGAVLYFYYLPFALLLLLCLLCWAMRAHRFLLKRSYG